MGLAALLLNIPELSDHGMPEPKTFPVYDDSGYVGLLLAPARFLDPRAEKTIRLENGQDINVPSAALRVQADGSFRLSRPARAENQAEPAAGAVGSGQDATPESAPPHGPARASFARAAADPVALPQAMADPMTNALIFSPPDETFFAEDYEIERVPIGRVVDAPVARRQEGETLVLPVIEEVLVYQKKLYLREEIRITRRSKPVEDVRKIEASAQPAED